MSHAVDFISTVRTGVYDELPSDGRVIAPMWRYPAMFIAAVGVSAERQYDAVITPWFFILALACMALANSAIQVIEMDGIRASARAKGASATD